MPQPTIRAQQLNSDDYNEIVGGALGATLIITSPIEGQTLTYSGSPLAWRNAVGGGGAGSVVAGDGLDSTAGAGSPFSGTFSVDATVARLSSFNNVQTFIGGSPNGDGGVALDIRAEGALTADEKLWSINNDDSVFKILTKTDAGGLGNSAIEFDRTGTTVDTVTIPAPTHLTSSGTGTSSALHISSNVPTLVFNDNDGGANATVWDITAGANFLSFRTRTDAHGSGATWLNVVRSGTTVTAIEFAGTAMTFNGLPIIAGGSPYTGGASGLGSPQIITGNLEVTGAVTMGSPPFTPRQYFVLKTIDETVNNSTTLQDDDHLFINNIANGYYQVNGILLFRDVAVSGCGAKFDFSSSGASADASAIRVSSKLFAGAGALSYDEQGLFTDTFDAIGLATGSATSRIMVTGVIEFFLSDNSIQLQWAQNSAEVNDLDLEADSFISLIRLGP